MNIRRLAAVGVGLLFMVALTLQSHAITTEAQAALPSRVAPASHALTLNPSSSYQTRSFLVPAQAGECQAIARAHPQFTTKRCYLSVAVEFRGKNAQPMATGSHLLQGGHVQTAYTSVTLCLSGPTMAGHGDCYRRSQNCFTNAQGPLPGCYPSWNAKVSTQFQYNGRAAKRIWYDGSILAGYGFVVHSSDAGLPKSSSVQRPLTIGQNLRVVGSIPVTDRVNVRYAVRMVVTPHGSVRYSVAPIAG